MFIQFENWNLAHLTSRIPDAPLLRWRQRVTNHNQADFVFLAGFSKGFQVRDLYYFKRDGTDNDRVALLFRLALPLDLLGSATNPILDLGLFVTCKGFRLAHYNLGGTRSQGNIRKCQPACAVVRIDGDDATCPPLRWGMGWARSGSGWFLHKLLKVSQWELLFDTVQWV